MEKIETTSELSDLFHNAEKAYSLQTLLKKQARTLSLQDSKEILDKLELAHKQGKEAISSIQDENEKKHAELALNKIFTANQEALRVFERKQKWETEVEANARLITTNANEASILHKKLREDRRQMDAKAVSTLKDKLADLERESLSAWGIVRHHTIPVGLEHRLFRATEAITNALKDSETTLSRKNEWEYALASNVSAIENELKILENILSESNQEEKTEKQPQKEIEDKKTSTINIQRKKIEDMLANRKPINREDLVKLSERYNKIISPMKAQNQPHKKIEITQHYTRDERQNALRELSHFLAQIESTLTISWDQDKHKKPELEADNNGKKDDTSNIEPIEPKKDNESQFNDLSDETTEIIPLSESDLEYIIEIKNKKEQTALNDEIADPLTTANIEEDKTENKKEDLQTKEISINDKVELEEKNKGENDKNLAKTNEYNYPILSEGAISVVRDLLQRSRHILEGSIIRSRDKKELWSRFRNANEHYKNAIRYLEKNYLHDIQKEVDEVLALSKTSTPIKARKAIKDTQAMLVESNIKTQLRNKLLKDLRIAWDETIKREETLKEEKKKKSDADLLKLSPHLERWIYRRDSIILFLKRLEDQLIDLKKRQQTSTSIGYRVLAEKRILETKNRITEEKTILEQLNIKIEDVEPKLTALGWKLETQIEDALSKNNNNNKALKEELKNLLEENIKQNNVE